MSLPINQLTPLTYSVPIYILDAETLLALEVVSIIRKIIEGVMVGKLVVKACNTEDAHRQLQNLSKQN